MTASPSSALASVFNVDGSASVAGKNTYDQMKSEDEQAHLVFKAGDVLIINGTGESTLKASLESQDGNGTFIFENGLLRVSDNASTQFSGIIKLQNAEAEVIHLNGFTGTEEGTIYVDGNSTLYGRADAEDQGVDVKVNAMLSGEGIIELTEHKDSTITLLNEGNEFLGTFKLTNGTLSWANAKAVKFFGENKETRLTGVTLDVASNAVFKSLTLSGNTTFKFGKVLGAVVTLNSLKLEKDSVIEMKSSGAVEVNGSLKSSSVLTVKGNDYAWLRVNGAAEFNQLFLDDYGQFQSSGLTIGSNVDIGSNSKLVVVKDLADINSLNLKGILANAEFHAGLKAKTVYLSDHTMTLTVDGALAKIEKLKLGGYAYFNAGLNAGTVNFVNGSLYLRGTKNEITALSGSDGTIYFNDGAELKINDQTDASDPLEIGLNLCTPEGTSAPAGSLYISRQNGGKVSFTKRLYEIKDVSFTNSLLYSSDSGTNTLLSSVANATLGSGSVLTIDEDQSINSLTLNGGTLSFDDHLLQVKNADLREGKVRIARKNINAQDFDIFKPPQFESQKLIESQSVITVLPALEFSDSGASDQFITQDGNQVAALHGDAELILSSDKQTLSAEYSVNIELLGLTGSGYRIEAFDNQELSSRLSGKGNVTYAAREGTNSFIQIASNKNDYTGATYVHSAEGSFITVEASDEKAFGDTELLSIGANGLVEILSAQNIRSLAVKDGGAILLNKTLKIEGQSASSIDGFDALRGSGTLALAGKTDLVITHSANNIPNNPDAAGFTGALQVAEEAKLTLRSDSQIDLPWTIKGTGEVSFDAAGAEVVIGSADRLREFTGKISFKYAQFAVNNVVAEKNVAALEGSVLTLSGKEKLGNFELDGAKLFFSGVTALGSTESSNAYLGVKSLTVNGSNKIAIDMTRAKALMADPELLNGEDSLSAQDVFSEARGKKLKTVLISSQAPIEGNGSFELVDLNDNPISAASHSVGIYDGQEQVADGIYSYGVSRDEKNIGVAWHLAEVSIRDGKTLALSEIEGEDGKLYARLSGSGGFAAQKGRITLVAENSYTGNTTVEKGSGIVVANDKSLGRTKGLKNSGTVYLADYKVTVAGGTENSGTIDIGMGTFTTESYAGKADSVLKIEARVTKDKEEAGKFVVTGVATGTSSVDLSFTDDSVGRAVTGIDVAQLGAGSTLKLRLAEEIQIGDYNYLLMKTDDGTRYYLVGSSKDGGGDDDKKPMTTSQLKTPEAGARAALAFLNQRAFDFGLNSHIGEKSYADPFTGEKKTTSLWLIQGGSWSKMDDSSGQLRNDGHMTTTNLGGDLYAWNNAGGRFSVGLMGGWVDGSYDVDSNITGLKTDADFDGWSLGAYAAWQHEGESGLFANGQVRWNDFTNEVKGQGLAKEKYHAKGLSLGVEAGWNQRLWAADATDGSRSMVWDAAPFARVTWSGVSADDQTDAYGQRFSVEGDGNVALTLGARTSFEFGSKDQTPRFADPIVRVYAEGAWVHNTKTFESTVVNDKGASTAEFAIDDYGQFRVGLEGEFTKNFRLWGDVTHEAGRSGYSSTGFTVGAKYVF